MTRLLLVDDEENILVGMRLFFRAHGFTVDCASERAEAEAMARHECYDAAIVDLGLTPGRGPDGLELVAALRGACPAGRIVVLTAVGIVETQEEALRLGADRLLQKPQPLARILGVLQELLAGAR